MRIGRIIRRLRKERDMTLAELSKKSRVALASLSRIENGRMTGTLESHMRISQALGTTLVELYKGLSPAGRGAEVRVTKPEHDILIRGGDFSAEMLGARTSDKRMTPLLLRIGKNGQTPRDETKRGAEKFLYVLEGKVEVNLGDDERYPLHRGDTIYFDSSIPHRFRNTGGNEARLICVTSRPA